MTKPTETEERPIMKTRRFIRIMLAVILFLSCASGESYEPLPMDSTAIAPVPQDECYISDREYKDDTISVVITEGDFERVHYWCARVKISHPSQLRTAPARQVNDPNAVFTAWHDAHAECTDLAAAVHAVVAINGDYFNDFDRCQVVLRQGQQVRNMSNSLYDVLIIDNDGNFDCILNCNTQGYKEYYKEHDGQIYQAFCFGPAMVINDEIVVNDKKMGKNYAYSLYDDRTQRMAIVQVGELDYLLITSDGDPMTHSNGLTIPKFAELCLTLGREANPEGGARVAYNLDGGNSASLVFKTQIPGNKYAYTKLNMPKLNRPLADMICFVSLVPSGVSE